MNVKWVVLVAPIAYPVTTWKVERVRVGNIAGATLPAAATSTHLTRAGTNAVPTLTY